MKNTKLVIYIFLVLFLLFVASCIWFSITYDLFEREEIGCDPTPTWVSEKDIIGTWIAQTPDFDTTDTLVFQDDGTYKQTIHHKNQEDEVKDFYYETDWQPWSLEYGKKGITYLYLQNLRQCALNYPEPIEYEDCDWVGDERAGWTDYCDGSPRKPLLGEVALSMLGIPYDDNPTGTISDIKLIIFRGYEHSAWFYRFQEP